MYSAVNCHSIQIDDPQSAVKHKLRSKLTAISPGAQVPEILWPMPRFCVKHVVLILSRVRGWISPGVCHFPNAKVKGIEGSGVHKNSQWTDNEFRGNHRSSPLHFSPSSMLDHASAIGNTYSWVSLKVLYIETLSQLRQCPIASNK